MVSSELAGQRILLGVSSSIAAYRALDLASELRKQGAEVRAVLTANVPNLVGVAAFDAITHQRTITSLWDSPTAGEMDHLAATKWADQFVICPATANVLGKIAHGIADDALTTLAIAWNKKPILFVPAMNPEMWRNAAVRANVQVLRERGHQFVGPVSGRLACDDVGEGRLATIQDVIARLYEKPSPLSQPTVGDDADLGASTMGAPSSTLAPYPPASLSPERLNATRVLITGGPTREFADDVRCITNPSTGRQAIALAEEAATRGAQVTLVLGPTILKPKDTRIDVVPVVSADDMLAAVLRHLPQTDLAIFAAAVSDWKPAERADGKMKKHEVSDRMELSLVRTPDIAAEANRRRRPGQVFIGFAAESENLRGYAGDKMTRKGFQIVFANPINENGAGFATETNRGLILHADGRTEEVASARKETIAARLLDIATPLLTK